MLARQLHSDRVIRRSAAMELSQRVTALAESATLAVSAKAARMKAEGIDVVSFGAGEPDFDTPENVKQAVYRAIESGHTGYSKPTSGIPAAKRAVCDKLRRENNLEYGTENIIITAGGKMCLYLAIHALVDPGDEVIIPAPYWVSYPEIVRLAGGEPVFIQGSEENDYKLDPNDLRQAITDRTRMFCITSPSNPSGVTYWPDEFRTLADVVKEHDLLVLSDEIYDRLVFNGQESISFASTGEAAYERTLTLNAASKTYAMTGWRIGYAAGPADLVRAMGKLQSQSTSGAATFTQHALVEALSGDQSAVERMRTEFERRAVYMHDRLTAIPGVRCPKPTGAFYCFPNVSRAFDRLSVKGSAPFADKLLEEANVAVVPGVAFGCDAHVRLSFAASMEQIEKGLDRIEGFLNG